MQGSKPVIVVEDDVWTRLIEVVLDPRTSPERLAAFADFMSPDVPDFGAWCEHVRKKAAAIFPSDVNLVSAHELHANLAPAQALVTESLRVGADELALAPQLKAVQKYGMIYRNIDVAACAARGVKVLGVRRRANMSCAEHAFALMLALSRRMVDLAGLISVDQLNKMGGEYKPFDDRHTPRANWGRFGGLRALNGATIGIIGLGEIGREIAVRAAAFGMRVLYHQRTPLTQAEEVQFAASYRPLDGLLGESDWVVPQLPLDASTRGILNRERLAQMKRGACIVNVSRAELIDRGALLEGLRSGHIGGFALDSQYEEPGGADDELLSFDRVVLTPHMAGSPRFNGLKDIEELIVGLAQALSR